MSLTTTVDKKKGRSVLTNDPRRLIGVDMGSSLGRRFRDIVDNLIREFGSAVDNDRLRELAGLKFSQEQMQARVVAGDHSAAEDLVRISNLIARRETELLARKSSAAAAITQVPVHERLAARATKRSAKADRPASGLLTQSAEPAE